MGQRLRAWTAYHMRDGRLNVLIVKPKKQVRCAPQLHQPALRADASGSQFSLFGPVMDTSAQIKQLPRRSRAAHHPAVMNKRRRHQRLLFYELVLRTRKQFLKDRDCLMQFNEYCNIHVTLLQYRTKQ